MRKNGFVQFYSKTLSIKVLFLNLLRLRLVQLVTIVITKKEHTNIY